MKTFRIIGTALMSVLMCASFTACSNDDDGSSGDDSGNKSGKKLTKIVSTSPNYNETYTFSYDSDGNLSSAKCESLYIDEEYGNETTVENYQFIWGDDVIKVKKEEKQQYGEDHKWEDKEEYMIYLRDGLVQFSDKDETYSYNSSKKFFKGEDEFYTTTAIWNGDKLMAVESTEDGGEGANLTYKTSCQNGYFPFISSIIDFGCEILFMAHPEIAGMETKQLPASQETFNNMHEEEYSYITLTYEFDEDGYISKVKADGNNAFTLTWE